LGFPWALDISAQQVHTSRITPSVRNPASRIPQQSDLDVKDQHYKSCHPPSTLVSRSLLLPTINHQLLQPRCPQRASALTDRTIFKPPDLKRKLILILSDIFHTAPPRSRFRGILIRWNKKAENYLGMLHLALGLITNRATSLLG
jgi:hypothetical protein